MNSKLVERCEILADIIREMRTTYFRVGITQTQRDLIETVIGAAIWYLPQPKGLWTGKMSAEAAEAMKKGARVCKDHVFPRKFAGRELLHLTTEELRGASLINLYLTKYGVFNIVTPAENKRLVKHQRANIFTSPEKAYEAAGIRLVQLPIQESDNKRHVAQRIGSDAPSH